MQPFVFPTYLSLDRMQRHPAIPNPLHALEKLRAVHQPALVINAAIDEIGIVERQLGGAVDDVVGGLDTQHERVVLVADLVAPAAEAAARVDAAVLELGQELFEGAFALERRGWVAVVEAAVVGADDLVGGAEHFGGDEAADAVVEEGGVVDGFHA